MLGRGTSLGGDALLSGLTWDVKDVEVLQRCLAAGTSLVCIVALPSHMTVIKL